MSHRIFSVPFADIYPHYVKKVERKGRTVSELYEVITWLTGYSVEGLERVRKQEVPLEDFFEQAPHLNPSRSLITGSICGHRSKLRALSHKGIRRRGLLTEEVARMRVPNGL